MAHHESEEPHAQDRPLRDAEVQTVQGGRDFRPEDHQDEIDLHGLANGIHGGGVPADAAPVQLQVDVHYASIGRFLLRALEQVIGRVHGLA